MKNPISFFSMILVSLFLAASVSAAPNPDAVEDLSGVAAMRALMNDGELFESDLPELFAGYDYDNSKVWSVMVKAKSGTGEALKYTLVIGVEFNKTVDLIGTCSVEATYAYNKYAANVFVRQGDLMSTCEK